MLKRFKIYFESRFITIAAHDLVEAIQSFTTNPQFSGKSIIRIESEHGEIYKKKPRVEFAYNVDHAILNLENANEQYEAERRRTGRTSQLIGSLEKNDIFVVHQKDMLNNFILPPNVAVISASNIKELESQLRGTQYNKVVIDNCAIYVMLQNYIEDFKSRIKAVTLDGAVL